MADLLTGLAALAQGVNTVPRVGRAIENEQRGIEIQKRQREALDALVSGVGDPTNLQNLQSAPQSALAAFFAPTEQDALKAISQRVAQDQTLQRNVDSELTLKDIRERAFGETLPGAIFALGGNEELAQTVFAANEAKQYATVNNILNNLFGLGVARTRASAAKAGSRDPAQIQMARAAGRTLADPTHGTFTRMVQDHLTAAGIDPNSDDEGAVLKALGSPDIKNAVLRDIIASGAAGAETGGQRARADQLLTLYTNSLIARAAGAKDFADYQMLTIGRAWLSAQPSAPQIAGATGAALEPALPGEVPQVGTVTPAPIVAPVSPDELDAIFDIYTSPEESGTGMTEDDINALEQEF